MLACCCTLAGTAACKTCPSYVQMFGDHTVYPRFKPGLQRVTEKYEDGKLVERIIEDI